MYAHHEGGCLTAARAGGVPRENLVTCKVVDGHIVVEGEALSEGSDVTVLVSEGDAFTLNAEDEAALLEAIGEADRGDLLDADDVLERLA
jgi:hypothetical protein